MPSAGEIIASNLAKQRSTNQALTHEGGSVPKLLVPIEEIELEDCTKIETRDIVGDGAWGIGFGNDVDNNGAWGEAGYKWNKTYSNEMQTVMQRCWSYEAEESFSEGTSSSNVTLVNGDIRLNI